MTVTGIIISLILGISIIEMGRGHDEEKLIGFLVIILGSFISWVSSFILYGYGEIIDLLTDIRDNTDNGIKDVEPANLKNSGNKIENTEPVNLQYSNIEIEDSEDTWICPSCHRRNDYNNSPECPHCHWAP